MSSAYTPTIITTIDGRQVASDGPEWRACCEAVRVLGMPEKDRAGWLQRIEKHRGAGGRKALEDEMDRVEPAYLLALGTKEARRAYLEQVARYRGEPARDWLQERLIKHWEQQKAAAAASSPADAGKGD